MTKEKEKQRQQTLTQYLIQTKGPVLTDNLYQKV